MKFLKSRRSQVPITVWLIIAGVILFLPTLGIVKFLFFTDKTPYIIGGLLVVLILFGRRNRG
jgi:hypothetical protein